MFLAADWPRMRVAQSGAQDWDARLFPSVAISASVVHAQLSELPPLISEKRELCLGMPLRSQLKRGGQMGWWNQGH